MKKNILALALLSVIASPAFAAGAGGFYGAIDAGSVTYSSATLYSTQNPNLTAFASPSAYRFAAGYNLSPMLAVEAGYNMLGDSTVVYTNATTTLKTSIMQVSAVGTYSINDTFDLQGLLGLAFNSMSLSGTGGAAGFDSSNSSTNLSYGVGAKYNISKQFGIRARYENFGSTSVTSTKTAALNTLTMNAGTSMFSVGAQYNF